MESAVSAWTVEQVVAWLVECGLEDLDDKFTSHKVDGARLLALTEEEMANELKIRSSMNRQVVLDKRQQLLAGDQPRAAVAVKDMLPVEFCASHNKALEVYCETDEVLICFDCLLATHNGHKFMPAREVPTTKGTQLKICVVQVSQDAQESKKRLEEVEEEMKVLDGTLETALEEVERRFAALHEVVEGRKTKVLEEVKLKHGEAREILEVRAARDQERLKLAGEIVSPLDKILRTVESNPLAALTMGTKEVTNAATSLLDSKPGVPDKSKPELEVVFSQQLVQPFQDVLTKVGRVYLKNDGLTYSTFRFCSDPLPLRVKLSEDDTRAKYEGASLHGFVRITPTIDVRTNPVSYIKFHVHQFGNVWMLLGILSLKVEPNISTNSYTDASCFAWGGSPTNPNKFYVAGKNTPTDWTGFHANDVCVLKLDMTAKTLQMHSERLQKVFTIPNIPEQDYYFQLNFYSLGDEVEILPVEKGDISLFA